MQLNQGVLAFNRYTRSQLMGIVRGVAISRGEVVKDPGHPLAEAERPGTELFTRAYSDYHLDTPRSARVWG